MGPLDVLRRRAGGTTGPAQKKRGTPNTVGRLADVELYVGEVVDQTGVVHEGLIFLIGGVPYFDENSEEWKSKLLRLDPKLAAPIMARIENHKKAADEDDASNVALIPGSAGAVDVPAGK